MQVPPLETRRTRLTTGEHTAGSAGGSKLDRLAASHPFVEQLDVVFTSSESLERALGSLEAKYSTCTSSLSGFVSNARAFVSEHEYISSIIALGTGQSDSDDVWCIDSRGVLTLAVGKTTYERLGLVGTRLPWKGCDDTFLIHISLQAAAPSDNSKATSKWHRLNAKVMQALERWDAQRQPWKVLYHLDGSETGMVAADVHHVRPAKRVSSGVHVPSSMHLIPPATKESGEADEYAEDISALFEWVGMASLGAQRLEANDRVNPFIAVYTPPSPSEVGAVTHLRWTGLLAPQFVQSVIDAAIVHAAASPSLIGLTLHNVPWSPVAYISGSSSPAAPLRAPRPESEDMTCLIVSSMAEGSVQQASCVWALAECIGQWDARWG